MTDKTELREKLCRIRDSNHPAAPWARNVVQCLDDLKGLPDDAELLRALGKNVAMFERAMHLEKVPHPADYLILSASEIAAIFGLGGDLATHQ